MPMYEFTCQSCGYPFEKKLRMSQVGEAQPCPTCGDTNTRRRFSTAIAIGGGSSNNNTAVAMPPPNSPFT